MIAKIYESNINEANNLSSIEILGRTQVLNKLKIPYTGNNSSVNKLFTTSTFLP